MELNKQQKDILFDSGMYHLDTCLNNIKEFIKWLELIDSNHLKYLEYAEYELNHCINKVNQAKELINGVI